MSVKNKQRKKQKEKEQNAPQRMKTDLGYKMA